MFSITDIYDQPREHQQEAFQDVMDAFAEGYKIVLLDLPTGIGKSGINLAVAKNMSDTFYTTPLTQLRDQLVQDEMLKRQGMVALRKKSSYKCSFDQPYTATVSSKYCESCQSHEVSCIHDEGEECGYGMALNNAIHSPITALTFARLIYDSFAMINGVPVFSDRGKIRFDDQRELLIVDECQSLESQVAGMFAGVSLKKGRYKVRRQIVAINQLDQEYNKILKNSKKELGDGEKNSQKINNVLIEPLCDLIKDNIGSLQDLKGQFDSESKNWKRTVDKYERLKEDKRKLERIRSEILKGKMWIADIEAKEGRFKGYKVRPLNVSDFLNNFVWNRGKKILLSSATIPQNTSLWLDRLGLLEGNKDDIFIVDYPSPFDESRRKIKRNYIARMSKERWKENLNSIASRIRELQGKHDSEKGIIHLSSYKQAKLLARKVDSRVFEKKYDNTMRKLEQWQDSSKQLFISPNGWEGLDLKYDKCRWGVLFKLNLPQVSTRLKAIRRNVGEKRYWAWYNSIGAMQFVQAIGRGMRARDDRFTYYVLDEYLNDSKIKKCLPDWLELQ